MAKKKLTNQQIADVLQEVALFLEAENVPFKPRAYETAVQTILQQADDLSAMYKECGTKCIDDLPGIGESIAEKIEELVKTGKLAYYDRLKKKYPVDMLTLTRIHDVGPKTVIELYKKLKIKTVRDLERAAKTGKIHELPGFGKKSEENILQGIGFLKEDKGRRLLHEVLPIAEAFAERLKKVSGVTHCDVTGSIRRRQETIGDLDMIISTSKPALAKKAFKEFPEAKKVLQEGGDLVMIQLQNGMHADLLILPPKNYGAGLHHFTGNREHNIELRTWAKKRGITISEEGIYKGKKRIAGQTEESIFKVLDMQFIPPELRIGGDEIELARKKKIPKLIEYGSLKGDLQVQTNWTDGSASIEDMVKAAREHGLEYIAITDHTKSLAMTGGLDEKKLLKQGKEIDALNKKLKGFRVLKSTECDILKDGRLDLKDEALKTLDVVSASIHSFFNLPENEQTERLIRAMKHPLVNIIFHPTGRKVLRRKPYALDMSRILRAAKQYKVAMEVNGSDRLDLRDIHIREAVKTGVKLVINSDAHAPGEFDRLDYGISQARRGWAEAKDVLNTKTVNAFLKAIQKS